MPYCQSLDPRLDLCKLTTPHQATANAVLGAIATQILPPFLSMVQLLTVATDQISQ